MSGKGKKLNGRAMEKKEPTLSFLFDVLKGKATIDKMHIYHEGPEYSLEANVSKRKIIFQVDEHGGLTGRFYILENGDSEK